MRAWVERVEADRHLASHIERWKQMRLEGWELTCLLASDHSHVVCVGFYVGYGQMRLF